MSSNLNLINSILWHDGMMLKAEHFKKLNDRFEQYSIYHARLSSEYNWGFRNYEIDTDLLNQGKLVVSNIEAVLPDGLIIHDSDHHKNILEYDLTSLYEKKNKKLFNFYLQVPSDNADLINEASDSHRYKQLLSEFTDDEEYLNQEFQIPYQVPNISLVEANELPNTHSSLLLLKLSYINGQFHLSDYIPPTVKITPLSTIWKIASGIVQKIRTKALFVARQLSPTSVQHDPIIIDRRMLIQNLVSGLPTLEAVLQTGPFHPYAIYLALCNVLGSIAPLGFDIVPPTIIPYNHNDLFATFNDLKNVISTILDESVGESYHAIPFNQDGIMFDVYINKFWLNQPLLIGITPKENKTEKEVLAWMLNCLIGTDQDIVIMKKERTLGAIRKQVKKDKNIPPTLDTLFFTLDTASLKPDQHLKIFNPSDSSGNTILEQINLYVRRRSDI